MAAYHYHLLLNGYANKPPTSVEETEAWVYQLVDKIGMKVVIDPRAAYVEKEGNRGMTAVVGIETSHIAMHVWDETDPSFVQFDLYTCSTLDIDIVIEELEKFLDLYEYQTWILDRSQGFKHIEAKETLGQQNL